MLTGKHLLVTGFANKWSLAWGVANAWVGAGARVSFLLQSDRFAPALRGLTAGWSQPPPVVALADITDSAQLDRAFDELSGSGLPLDGLLHAIAHAPKAALGPELTSVSNADFHSTFDVSVYSLIELTRRCSPLMPAGGSITALTFQGSQQPVPAYGLMGPAKAALECTARYLAVELAVKDVRVNCISAGPIATLAARGIPGFTGMLADSVVAAPLKRPLTTADVGAVAVFLASTSAASITGQTLHVDNGLSLR